MWSVAAKFHVRMWCLKGPHQIDFCISWPTHLKTGWFSQSSATSQSQLQHKKCVKSLKIKDCSVAICMTQSPSLTILPLICKFAVIGGDLYFMYVYLPAKSTPNFIYYISSSRHHPGIVAAQHCKIKMLCFTDVSSYYKCVTPSHAKSQYQTSNECMGDIIM